MRIRLLTIITNFCVFTSGGTGPLTTFGTALPTGERK